MPEVNAARLVISLVDVGVHVVREVIYFGPGQTLFVPEYVASYLER
jgi:hypothetical protein